MILVDWLKFDEWVPEQYQKIRDLWAEAGIPYEWDRGIHPTESIAEGKRTPEGARIAHKQQLDLGWDVGGNVGIEEE